MADAKLPWPLLMAVRGAIFVAHAKWRELISVIVPDPYLDEVFHIPQALAYWHGRWSHWDPKITTPPGLYYYSWAISQARKLVDPAFELNTNELRLVSFITFYLLAVALYFWKRSSKHQVRDGSDLPRELVIVSSPLIFFFSGLYYTDLFSALTVVITYSFWSASVEAAEDTKGGFQTLHFMFGGLSLLARQTNIFWVSVFLGGLQVLRTLKKSYQGQIYDPEISNASLEDYAKSARSLVQRLFNSNENVLFQLFSDAWPSISLLTTFIGFVIGNGGVVLGDKSNHVATLHLSQMLYFWPAVVFFSWPALLPSLFTLLTSKEQARTRFPRTIIVLGLLAIFAFVVYFNTIVHPFILADNRHYTFYVFRILRQTWIRYAAVPIYLICGWLCIHALGKPAHQGKAPNEEDIRVGWVIVFLISTTLSLVTAPLVEPRYFLIPWLIWRMNLPAISDVIPQQQEEGETSDNKKEKATSTGIMLHSSELDFNLFDEVLGECIYMWKDEALEWSADFKLCNDLGKMVGSYGETAIQTPHIDALAANGTLFEKAFASTASCSGSRSVIYTGLHTHQNGQYGLAHAKHHFMTFDNVETAPGLLRSIGYLTGIIGKIHVGPDAVYPWEVRKESASRDVDWVASKAAQFFQTAAQGDRPFFLTIGFTDPHRDSTRGGFANQDPPASNEIEKLYTPDEVRVPDFLPDLPEVRVELAEYYRSISRLDRGIGLVLDALSKSGLDSSTLVVFVSDNGAPFVNSKTTLYDAGVWLPLIIRNPSSSEAFGVRNHNLVSFVDILPTFLDWAGYSNKSTNASTATAVTITETTETESPIRLGRSLLPILHHRHHQALPGWTQVYGSHTFHEVSNYYPTRFIRTARYKYHRNVAWKLDFPFSVDLYASLSWEGIRNSGGGENGTAVLIGPRPLRQYVRRAPEELYDLSIDPLEVKNLAQSPDHQEILLGLRRDMEKWQNETLDPWLFRDGIALLEMQPHINAGLKIPDRFDFDVDSPGNR
ncbi:hypothetical protein DV735_g3348, partial [Chaetothyriales sp. CBS 134920]